MTLTPQDLADGLARNAGSAPHDPDRHAWAGQIQDLPVERLPDLGAIPLKAFGACQGRGIYRSDGASALRRQGISELTAARNAADAFSNRCQRSATCRAWGAASVAAAT